MSSFPKWPLKGQIILGRVILEREANELTGERRLHITDNSQVVAILCVSRILSNMKYQPSGAQLTI